MKKACAEYEPGTCPCCSARPKVKKAGVPMVPAKTPVTIADPEQVPAAPAGGAAVMLDRATLDEEVIHLRTWQAAVSRAYDLATTWDREHSGLDGCLSAGNPYLAAYVYGRANYARARHVLAMRLGDASE